MHPLSSPGQRSLSAETTHFGSNAAWHFAVVVPRGAILHTLHPSKRCTTGFKTGNKYCKSRELTGGHELLTLFKGSRPLKDVTPEKRDRIIA